MSEIDYIGVRRILAGTKADITVSFFKDGDPVNVSGTVMFEVVGVSGATVASGSATTSGNTITAPLAAADNHQVDLLTVTWAGIVIGSDEAIEVVTEHEAVGAWLFSLAEARNYRNGALRADSKYKLDVIREQRDVITDQFEQVLGYRLGRRLIVEERSVRYATGYRLAERYPNAVRELKARDSGGQWVDVPFVADSSAEISITSSPPRYDAQSTLRVIYEAGMQPITPPLKEAGLALLVARLQGSEVPANATQQTGPHGTFQLANDGAWFGIPDVDRALKAASTKLPGFA